MWWTKFKNNDGNETANNRPTALPHPLQSAKDKLAYFIAYSED